MGLKFFKFQKQKKVKHVVGDASISPYPLRSFFFSVFQPAQGWLLNGAPAGDSLCLNVKYETAP